MDRASTGTSTVGSVEGASRRSMAVRSRRTSSRFTLRSTSPANIGSREGGYGIVHRNFTSKKAYCALVGEMLTGYTCPPSGTPML